MERVLCNFFLARCMAFFHRRLFDIYIYQALNGTSLQLKDCFKAAVGTLPTNCTSNARKEGTVFNLLRILSITKCIN